MMFRNEREVRVAHAIDNEQYLQRNGFMALDGTFDRPSDMSFALAHVAILAADGETAELEKLRTIRRMWLDLLFDAATLSQNSAT